MQFQLFFIVLISLKHGKYGITRQHIGPIKAAKIAKNLRNAHTKQFYQLNRFCRVGQLKCYLFLYQKGFTWYKVNNQNINLNKIIQNWLFSNNCL